MNSDAKKHSVFPVSVSGRSVGVRQARNRRKERVEMAPPVLPQRVEVVVPPVPVKDPVESFESSVAAARHTLRSQHGTCTMEVITRVTGGLFEEAQELGLDREVAKAIILRILMAQADPLNGRDQGAH